MSAPSFDNVDLSDARSIGGKCPELCAVCGDSSSGYHYDVPSCSGCKTFFRRTIIGNRKFECRRDGKCKFNKDVRCACRACRFRRCIEAGMNPKVIQHSSNPAEVSEKRKLIETGPASDVSPDSKRPVFRLRSQPSIATSSADSADSSNDLMVKRLMDIELKCEYLRTSNFPAGSSVLDQLYRPCALDDITIYTKCTSWKEENPSLRMRHWLQIDLTIVIEYAKSFDVFRRLSLTDKCALLQQVGMSCCAALSHWNAVRKGHDRLVYPCGYVPSKDFPCPEFRAKMAKSRLFQAFKRHEFDRTEYALMKAILFFNSDCWELSEDGKKQIEAERQKCLDALFKHMCAEYGAAGPGKFGMILALLPTLQDSAEQTKDRMRVGDILRQRDIGPFLGEMILGNKISL